MNDNFPIICYVFIFLLSNSSTAWAEIHNTRHVTCFVTDERKTERAVLVRPQAWVVQRRRHTLLVTRVWLTEVPVAKQRGAAVRPQLFPAQADPHSVRPRQGGDGCIFRRISNTVIYKKKKES